MTDPLENSPEWQAKLDQLRAASRELAEMLEVMVTDLRATGWTEDQARDIVAAAMRASGRET